MWNVIFEVMNLQYVEDESMFKKFKKFLYRGFLVMFWSPAILLMKVLKRFGWKPKIEEDPLL